MVPWRDVIGPVLMVEILSPTNKTETWTNVWAYTTIPTVTDLASVDFSVPLRSVYRGGDYLVPMTSALCAERWWAQTILL